MKPIEIAKLFIRILLGVLFITTAIMKLISIDGFELYIYSFGIFNYVLVSLLARMLIAFELFVGFFLIARIWYKPIWWLTMLMMIGFTLFLCYVSLFRNDANCHCFGEIIQLNPINSIVKNLITIILLLLVRNEKEYQFSFRKWLIGLVLAAVIIVPFIVFPMDSLYNKIKSPDKEFNMNAFEILQQDSMLTDLHFDDDDYFVAFFISGCQYCKLSIQKIASIVEKNQLDHHKIVIMIAGNPDGIDQFKKASGTEHYHYYLSPPRKLLDVVYGKFPTFFYMKEGKVVKAVDFRGVDEKEMVDFLK